MKTKTFLQVAANIWAAAFMLLISSCKEDAFDPIGDFKEEFSLNCVLNASAEEQTATISKSYFVDGLDPYENTDDPFISGAEIKIWKGNAVYVFKDTSVARNEGDRYTTPFHYYKVSNITLSPGDELEIEALLPNGKRLKSTTVVPAATEYYPASCDSIIPSADKNFVYVTWSQQAADVFYLPRAILYYYQTIDGRQVRKSKLVPSYYVEENGVKKPVYHTPSFRTSAAFDNAAFTEALNEISEGESKADFSILAVVFETLVFDRPLTAYYSTANIDANNFSVLIDKPDYTNIEGGLGIFGSYNIKKFSLRFDEEYLKSLGYY
jgi:hypothetical protein